MRYRKMIEYFPVISMLLIEYGDAGLLWKMWRVHSGFKLAYWVTLMSCVLLALNIITVIHFS